MSHLPHVRLGLGTAQMGLPYGKMVEGLTERQCFQILEYATQIGIDFFDTAVAYGCAEARLGRFGLAQKTAPTTVIATKIPRVNEPIWRDTAGYVKLVIELVGQSLARLKMQYFELLQFHQCDLQFLGSQSARIAMSELLNSGLCRNIGVSVYEPEEAVASLKLPQVSALQVPVNLIDHRFVTPAFKALYEAREVSIIARSIFLRGLLASRSPDDPLPPANKAPALRALREHLRTVLCRYNLTLPDAARRYVFGSLAGTVEVGLLGVETVAEFKENCQFLASVEPLSSEVTQAITHICTSAAEMQLQDPSRWN